MESDFSLKLSNTSVQLVAAHFHHYLLLLTIVVDGVQGKSKPDLVVIPRIARLDHSDVPEEVVFDKLRYQVGRHYWAFYWMVYSICY